MQVQVERVQFSISIRLDVDEPWERIPAGGYVASGADSYLVVECSPVLLSRGVALVNPPPPAELPEWTSRVWRMTLTANPGQTLPAKDTPLTITRNYTHLVPGYKFSHAVRVGSLWRDWFGGLHEATRIDPDGLVYLAGTHRRIEERLVAGALRLVGKVG